MSVNLEIRVGRPWHGLGGAYARGEEAALRWYPADWRDPDAWRARARVVGELFDKDARERAVAALRAPTEDVRRALARVVDEGGFLITTGQQPGLFTGPLYTIHKALSAVALARSLEGVLDAPVVPVFWIPSEDHDWAEVDHADLIGVDNELHRVSVPAPARAGELPLHRLPVGPDIEAAVAAMIELLPQTEFSPLYFDLLRRCWRAGVTLPDGVRTTLEGLLGPFGMAFVDAADPVLKLASRRVLESEVRSVEGHERGLSERAGELETAGWPVQVPVLEGGVNLFIEGTRGARATLSQRRGVPGEVGCDLFTRRRFEVHARGSTKREPERPVTPRRGGGHATHPGVCRWPRRDRLPGSTGATLRRPRRSPADRFSALLSHHGGAKGREGAGEILTRSPPRSPVPSTRSPVTWRGRTCPRA